MNNPNREFLAGETVSRFAVLIRDANNRVELLGQIHTTEREAMLNASYWQDHYTGSPVTAEVVPITVPTRGSPAPSQRTS